MPQKRHSLADQMITLFVAALIVIAVIKWFLGFEGLILSGDTCLPLNPNAAYTSSLFTWFDKFGAGYYNALNSLLPFYFGVWVLSDFFSLRIAEFSVFLFFAEATFWSFYFLARTLLNSGKKENGGSVVGAGSSAALASLLYTFNPVSFHAWYAQQFTTLICFAFIPLSFLFYYKALEETASRNRSTKVSLKWLVMSVISSCPIIFSDLVMIYLWLFLVVGFTAYFVLVVKKNDRKRFAPIFLICLPLFVILSMLLNAWWMLPYGKFLLSSEERLPHIRIVSGAAGVAFLKASTAPSTLLELFRILGSGDMYHVNRMPASEFYTTNPLFMFMGWIMTIISLGILTSRKTGHKRPLLIFFALVYVVSLFVTKGLNPPLADVNLFLFNNVSIFRFLRSPWKRVMLFSVLSLSVLLAFSLHELFKKILKAEKRKVLYQSESFDPGKSSIKVIHAGGILHLPKLFALGLLLIMLVGYSYPFTSGNIFVSTGTPTLGYEDIMIQPFHVVVPQYYYAAAQYINEQPENFSIVFLPFSVYYASFTWGYTGSWNSFNLFDKPVANVYIMYPPDLGNVSEGIINSLYESPSASCGQILAMIFNAKYVLLSHDWNLNYAEYFPKVTEVSKWEKSLPEGGFALEKRFGEISIYRNLYWTEDNTIYIPNMYIYDADIRKFARVYPRPHRNANSKVLFLESGQIITEPTMSQRTPELHYVNHTRITSGRGDVNLDYAKKVWSHASLRANGTAQNGFFEMSYDPPGLWDFGRKGFIDFWFMCDVGGLKTDYVGIKDSYGVWREWFFAYPEANIWMPITLPIDEPTQQCSTANMTLAEINSIYFGVKDGPLDDDQTSFWSEVGDTCRLSNNSTEKESGADSLMIQTSSQQMNFGHVYADAQDLYGKEIISFWWYGANTSHTIRFQLFTDCYNRRYWTFTDDFSGWKKIVFNIEKYEYQLGTLDLTNVHEMEFWDQTGKTNATFFLDNLLIADPKEIQLGSRKYTMWIDSTEFPFSFPLKVEPNFTSVKVNPTKYIISINASTDFVLVLSQSYDTAWEAYVDGKPSDAPHFPANGFANAWYINKTGSYMVTLIYQHQHLFITGAVISASTLAGCIGFLLEGWKFFGYVKKVILLIKKRDVR